MNTHSHISLLVLSLVFAGAVAFVLPQQALASAGSNGCHLVIDKAVDKAVVAPGEIVEYTIRFKNKGTGDCTGTGVHVEDYVDPRITFISETHSAGVTPGYVSWPLYMSADRLLNWNAMTVSPGEELWVKWKGQVSASCPETIPNKAFISAVEYDNFNFWLYSNTVNVQVDCGPELGCIDILKETYDTAGNPLAPVAQFTFKLNNATTTQNNASGAAKFINVQPGTHTVTEILPSGWQQLSVTPANGTIIVPPGPTCAAVVFKNKQVLEPKVTIKAKKIVCDSEADLPNWSGGANITASTASDFLATHPNCHLETGWKFQYADGDTANPGDNVGIAAGAWTTFVDDNLDGLAEISFPLSSLGDASKIWMREAIPPDYIPFAGIGLSNNSAEMWCHTDVLNYDNFDFIDAPQNGQTYHCLAFNAKPTPPPGLGCINIVKETYNTAGNPITPVAQFTFKLNNATTTQNNSSGFAQFTNVPAGTHTVSEVLPSTWQLLSVTPNSGTVTVTPGSNCATVTFKNKQIIDTPPGPVCTLSISKNHIRSGEAVKLTWSAANVTFGFINNNVGTTTPVTGGTTEDIFPSTGTTYTGTFSGPYGTTTCAVAVTVETGCQGSCGGGGLNPPNVVLSQKPGEQPFAFVYLAQIPYTGFEAGPLLTAFYWFMLALWSAAVVYAMKHFNIGGLFSRFAFTNMPRSNSGAVALPESDDREDTQYAYLSGSATATFPQPIQAPIRITNTDVSAPRAPSNTPSAAAPVSAPVSAVRADDVLVEKLETRAHAAGVLISPEALRFAAALKEKSDETLGMFSTVLSLAVQSLPREEGWVLLSKERIMALVDKIEGVTVTPFAGAQASQQVSEIPASVLSATLAVETTAPIAAVEKVSTNSLAQALLSGNREAAFAAIRGADQAALNTLLTAALAELDETHRARVAGKVPAHAELAAAAARFNTTQFEQIVSLLASAVDTTYASPETAAKLALTRVLAVTA